MSSAVVISASYDKHVRLWDPYTGRTTRSFQVADSQVNCMCLSPERARLAVGLCGRIRWFDYTSFAQCCVLEQTSSQQAFGNFTSIAYIPVSQEAQANSSINTCLIVATNEDSFLRLIDARSSVQARVLREIPTGGVALTCGLLFPDNSLFLCGSQVGRVSVWDVVAMVEDAKNNTPISQTKPLQEVCFADDHSAVRSISVSPLATWVAVALNSGMVHALRFSRDVPRIAASPIASAAPSTVNVITPSRKLNSLATAGAPQLPDPAGATDLSSSAEPLNASGAVVPNDSETGGRHPSDVGLPPSLDANTSMPTAGANNNSSSLQLQQTSESLLNSAMSPTVRGAGAALTAQQVHHQLEEFCAFRAHNKYILKCVISPNGQLLATSSADYTIALWQVPLCVGGASPPTPGSNSSPEQLRTDDRLGASTGAAPPQLAATAPLTPTRNAGGVTNVLTSPLTAADPSTFTLIRSLQGHTRWVWDVLFSPDSANIISSSSDTHVRLWSNVLDKPKSEAFVGHTKPVNCIVLDYDRKIKLES